MKRAALLLFVLAALLAALLAACGAPPPEPSPSPQLTAETQLPAETLSPGETRLPSPSSTSSPSPSPSATATPSPTPTLTPTPTATIPPVGVGTPLPALRDPIIQANLDRVRQVAQWGRGRADGLAWSPGDRLVAITTPLGIYLYNTQNFTVPLLVETGGRVSRPVFSPDGRYLAVDVSPPGAGVGQNAPPREVQVWDLGGTTGQGAPAIERLAVLPTGGPALAMTFLPSGELYVAAGVRGGAQFQRWDVPGKRQLQAMNLITGDTAAAADFSPDFRLLAIRPDSGPVRLWRLANGMNIASTQVTDRAGALAFSPDGALLAVAYPDTTGEFTNQNQVRVWRVPPGGGALAEVAYTLTNPATAVGEDETLISLAWSPDGAFIAAGSIDHRISVWRAGAPFPVYRTYETATLPRFLAWAPPGFAGELRLASGSLEVWDLGAENPALARAVFTDDFLPGLFDLKFSPDGSQLALASYGQIDLRATRDGTRSQAIGGMRGPVRAIAYSPDGARLLAACQDGTTRLFRSADGTLQALVGEPSQPMLAVDYSSNGDWIVTAGENMLVRVYRALDLALMHAVREPFVSYKLLFSPNNNQFASLTTSGVRLRGFFSTLERVDLDWEAWVGGVGLTDIAYSPGQEFLALVGSDVVRIYDPVQREEVYVIYEPNGALPWSVAFSPDNAFLAVGYSNGLIGLYWAQDGRLMHQWSAHPDAVTRLIFREDGLLLASLGAEGTLRLWGVGQGE